MSNEMAAKSYNGEMMRTGRENEEIILKWLKNYGRSVIDFREFRLAQRIDVDFGIETIDGEIVLAEIKSDKWIEEKKNLCFECNRINHYAKEKWFYLGWGWRSPAQKLIVRNPNTSEIFVFDFPRLRAFVGNYIAQKGRAFRSYITIVETDEQKTTFNYLIPMAELKGYWKKYIFPR